MASDIFTHIKVNTTTFEDYKKWLFTSLKGDKQAYINLGKSSDAIKINTLVKYLEHKQVPFLSALCYYSYLHNGNYESLKVFTIRCEFKRIEKKKTVNYVPF